MLEFGTEKPCRILSLDGGGAKRKKVTTDKGDVAELIDGGYCANNPTLYAIADAIMALKLPELGSKNHQTGNPA